MIALLIKDLAKEMTEAETDGKNSQAEYEQIMKDSAAKRATEPQDGAVPPNFPQPEGKRGRQISLGRREAAGEAAYDMIMTQMYLTAEKLLKIDAIGAVLQARSPT